MAGEVDRMVLLDVIPHTLGVETSGGLCTPLIKRNTTIPTSRSEIFSTAADGQTAVGVKVLQGESKLASDNKLIGDFLLTGIRKAPRGVPQIEVEFDMDANGILNVSAKDLNTGQAQAIRIETTGGLSEDELLQMEDDAQQASTDAQTRKRLMESRNRAERAIFDARKLLDSSGNSMSDEYREKIVRAVGAAEAALQGEDAFAIREAADELAEVRENIGQ